MKGAELATRCLFYVPTGAFLYVPYSLLLISYKCVPNNLTALCTILRHWGLEGVGGMGHETSHVHKIIYGPMIDTALYVMCLMGANLLHMGPYI